MTEYHVGGVLRLNKDTPFRIISIRSVGVLGKILRVEGPNTTHEWGDWVIEKRMIEGEWSYTPPEWIVVDKLLKDYE
jgi:hypothetical protein